MSMETGYWTAVWLFVPALPLALWVAWSDLRFMRISNRVVLGMGCVFLIFGLIALPFEVWLWRLLQIVIVLAVGFVANNLGLIGGGDAKYAAAIAPFFAPGDIREVILIFAAMLLAAYVTHRLFQWLPPVRRMTPDWKSWQSGKDFPMGLALSGTLLGYLALPILAPWLSV